jgi:hypothetical protein
MASKTGFPGVKGMGVKLWFYWGASSGSDQDGVEIASAQIICAQSSEITDFLHIFLPRSSF